MGYGTDIVIAMVVAAFLACLALGWIVPLVMGIVRLRRKMPGGVAATAAGAVWGLLSISVIAIGIAFYAFAQRQEAVATKVEAYDASQDQGSKGSIVLPFKGRSTLELIGEGGKMVRLSTQDGTIAAPAGTFRPVSYEAIGKSEDGNEWAATCTLSSRSLGTLTVAEGSSQYLRVGPPFTASVSVKTKGQNEATLDLKLVGVDGNQYTIMRRDGRGEPPAFQVIALSGETLWQGKFEYG